jgi:NlpC/P60 family putative phage cell wall peptidase
MALVSAGVSPDEGLEIADRARAWIGTPYQHQASLQGCGTDCLGLLRGVWRETYGTEPEEAPPYPEHFGELGGTELFEEALTRNLIRIPTGSEQIGDVVLFRLRARAIARHVGFLAKHPGGFCSIVHAFSAHGVVESPLTSAWRSKTVRFFRFPSRRH